MGALTGKIALVAGATRGAGRGIAVALGEQGATVICTGRSVGGKQATPGRTETLEETVKRVQAAGGQAVAIRCDHTVRDDVQDLARRVANEYGGLDILVNDLWGGDALTEWGKPFWEMDLDKVQAVWKTAVWGHVMTAHAFAPLLIQRGGLHVEITDGDSFQYRGVLSYDLAKTFAVRFAFDLQEDFGDNAMACAVTPGFLRSEAMLDHFGVTQDTWRDAAAKDPNFLHSETPLFVGRGIAHLAADSRRRRFAGRVLSSWSLAREYGYVDADARRPDWGAHFAATYPGTQKPCDDAFYGYWTGWGKLKDALTPQ